MKGILWFDEWGNCDACDISLRLSFKALSPADCHVLWAIWLHCAPEVQEEQWRRDNTDTDRQRQRLDLSNDSIQAITLHDGREKPRRILAKQPCSVPDQGYTAPCLACCHLNSELVASKDRYVSTLPDWGEVNMSAAGGGPPGHSDALRILLLLSTPLSRNLPRAAVGEEKGEVEFDRNRDRELLAAWHTHFYR